MSFGGTSKLIELPPAALEDAPSAQRMGFVEASNARELTGTFQLSDEVLGRVLYRGDTFGPYRILGFVGAGGMGEIYAAERLSDDGARRRPVALKVVSAEHTEDHAMTMAQLERESKICRAIHSRHVVRIYEYGVDEKGRCFMAMELLQGEELFDRMRARKVIPLRELAELGVQILRGLHTVHRAGVIHRDIKPENIFLAREPKTGKEIVKILDFGIARWKKDDGKDMLAQSPDQIFGTPAYLSPEQSRSPKVDWRSDVYSVGVILYECATGSSPFERDNPYATIVAHQQDPVPLMPSTLDPEFCEIVYRALAKKKSDRWQTADEFRWALDNWLDNTSWVDDLPGGDMGMLGGVSAEELMSGRPLRQPQTTPSRSHLETPFFTPNDGVVRRTMGNLEDALEEGHAPGSSRSSSSVIPSADSASSTMGPRDAMEFDGGGTEDIELDWGAFKPEPATPRAPTPIGGNPTAPAPASRAPSHAPRAPIPARTPGPPISNERPSQGGSNTAATVITAIALLAILGGVLFAIVNSGGRKTAETQTDTERIDSILDEGDEVLKRPTPPGLTP